MDLSHLPVDFFVTSTQFTKTTHRDEYPGIDPRSPALSQKGKVVVITGTSQGIGRYGFAQAFAKADAKAIILIARKRSELEAAKSELHEINPNVTVLTQAMDISDEEAVRALFARIKSELGTVDVLVNNAGSGQETAPIKDANLVNFWHDFEVNVKGTFLMTQEFLRLVGTEKAASIINVTSAGGIAVIPHTAPYSLSKLVQIQIQRFVAAENPNVVAVSLHPGTILTPITKPAFVRFSLDTFELAGGVAVWLATEKAKFMNGRYMGANWAVEDLMEREAEIVSKGLLLPELQGTFGLAQFQS